MSEQNGSEGYDPGSNVRSLTAPPDPEALRSLEKDSEKLRRGIARYDQILTIFQNPAWRHIDQELAQDVQRAVNALADPKRVNNANVLAYIQGQIEAFQKLRQLGHIILARREIDANELQSVTAELEQHQE